MQKKMAQNHMFRGTPHFEAFSNKPKLFEVIKIIITGFSHTYPQILGKNF
jgi:hypothetical protein